MVWIFYLGFMMWIIYDDYEVFWVMIMVIDLDGVVVMFGLCFGDELVSVVGIEV